MIKARQIKSLLTPKNVITAAIIVVIIVFAKNIISVISNVFKHLTSPSADATIQAAAATQIAAEKTNHYPVGLPKATAAYQDAANTIYNSLNSAIYSMDTIKGALSGLSSDELYAVYLEYGTRSFTYFGLINTEAYNMTAAFTEILSSLPLFNDLDTVRQIFIKANSTLTF